MDEYDPVVASMGDLHRGLDQETLSKAFGVDSLGIILIKDLPAEFIPLRLKVLKSLSILANLSPEELVSLESEESHWLIGWSRGKEKLANGHPDTHKGSFYVNCAFHKDEALESPPGEVVEAFGEFKAYTSRNIWPSEHNSLQDFKLDCKKLCNLIIDIAQLVAKNCDSFISSKYSSYEKNYLERVVENSFTTKARFLHYYPKIESSSIPENINDDWCGTHLDHSCLTGLTSALFLDESKGLTHDLERSPDVTAGLYIKNRKNETVKVNIPADCLAFQTGSALQEVSKQQFKAVPHYVKGTNIPNIARNTLAVFCQPNLDEKINESENFAEFSERILNGNH